MRIASFDVGKKNFAQYVEEIDVDAIKELEARYKALPRSQQRRVKGVMNDEVKEILDALCCAGKRVQMGVYDLRSEECKANNSKGVDMQTRKNVIAHLESHATLWSTCDIFVIEQQFVSTFTPRGRKNPTTQANIDAIKIGELVIGWFLMQYPFKEIVHYGAQFKTQILGAPNSLNKYQRKKWAVAKATEIFIARSDNEALRQMKGKKKQDDVADACIQCQAFKYREMVALF